MNRRGFLGSLFRGAVSLPLMPAIAFAGATSRRVVVQHSPVAGFQYYDGEHMFRRLRVGMPLELRREPENRHDARAVAVYAAGRKLGYMPRLENTAVSQMLDRGERLVARIIDLKRSDNPWQRVRFEVVLDG